MSLSRGSSQDLWPKWMWIAVPVLVVVVVAGLWWIINPSPKPPATATPTPTARPLKIQPTQGLTPVNTLPAPAAVVTATQSVPIILPTFTPTAALIVTPTAPAAPPTPVAAASLAVGGKVTVKGTGGSGLNMRSGAGSAQPRVKTLAEGSVLEVIGGPKEANGFTWWQVRDAAGTSGWVASQFLAVQ